MEGDSFMCIDFALMQVDVERLYNTIIELEGPKYPLDNMDALNKACEDIEKKFISYGIKTEIHEFHVKGMDETFKNIIAYVGDVSRGATLIGSHYDTVRNSPGANDNLSAVAVSLEVARVLSLLDNPPPVIFCVFSLEEGHPGIAKAIEDKLIKNRLLDEKFRPRSISFFRQRELINKERRKRMRKGLYPLEVLNQVKVECEGRLDSDGLFLMDTLIEVFSGYTSEYDAQQIQYPIGSFEFVEKMKKEKINVKEVIVYDCLGWIKDEDYSQKPLPISKLLLYFTKRHKISFRKQRGNYIGVIGSKSSDRVYKSFLKSCKKMEIDLPFIGVKLPLDFKALKKKYPDMLRSDHAAFWKEDIPGIFVSDMANFRSEYYHTAADVSAFLDYEALKKVAQATLKTILDNSGELHEG